MNYLTTRHFQDLGCSSQSKTDMRGMMDRRCDLSRDLGLQQQLTGWLVIDDSSGVSVGSGGRRSTTGTAIASLHCRGVTRHERDQYY